MSQCLKDSGEKLASEQDFQSGLGEEEIFSYLLPIEK